MNKDTLSLETIPLAAVPIGAAQTNDKDRTRRWWVWTWLYTCCCCVVALMFLSAAIALIVYFSTRHVDPAPPSSPPSPSPLSPPSPSPHLPPALPGQTVVGAGFAAEETFAYVSSQEVTLEGVQDVFSSTVFAGVEGLTIQSTTAVDVNATTQTRRRRLVQECQAEIQDPDYVRIIVRFIATTPDAKAHVEALLATLALSQTPISVEDTDLKSCNLYSIHDVLITTQPSQSDGA